MHVSVCPRFLARYQGSWPCSDLLVLSALLAEPPPSSSSPPSRDFEENLIKPLWYIISPHQSCSLLPRLDGIWKVPKDAFFFFFPLELGQYSAVCRNELSLPFLNFSFAPWCTFLRCRVLQLFICCSSSCERHELASENMSLELPTDQ